ncbi:MAG: M50 family metallopeptidase [Thiolinea sp.]
MEFDQREYDKKPASRGEIFAIYGMVLVFLLLMLLDILNNYEPRKLGALMFVVWWMPLVLLHEFGHALMARMLGWRISRTVVGFGRVVHYGRLFNAPLELRMIPLEGFVQIAPLTATGARFKHALIYFAGPGIELLLFFIIMLAMGTDNFFRIEDEYGRLMLQALAFAALAGAVINLIPMGVVTRDGNTPNDGMGIILSLFSKDEVYHKWVAEARQEQADQREM